MLNPIVELSFVIRNLGDNKFLAIDDASQNPFGSRIWLLEAIVGTVLADKSGAVLQKIFSGEGFGTDGFAYFPPEKWGMEKVENLRLLNAPFFNGFEVEDLWIVGTNDEGERFSIVPRSYLLAVLEYFEFFNTHGELPGRSI